MHLLQTSATATSIYPFAQPSGSGFRVSRFLGPYQIQGLIVSARVTDQALSVPTHTGMASFAHGYEYDEEDDDGGDDQQ